MPAAIGDVPPGRWTAGTAISVADRCQRTPNLHEQSVGITHPPKPAQAIRAGTAAPASLAFQPWAGSRQQPLADCTEMIRMLREVQGGGLATRIPKHVPRSVPARQQRIISRESFGALNYRIKMNGLGHSHIPHLMMHGLRKRSAHIFMDFPPHQIDIETGDDFKAVETDDCLNGDIEKRTPPKGLAVLPYKTKVPVQHHKRLQFSQISCQTSKQSGTLAGPEKARVGIQWWK
jgi:hypothetical protein